MKKLVILLIGFVLIGCNIQQEKSLGDKTIDIFKNQSINFIPKSNKDSADTKIFTDGRLVLRKVTLPKYQKDVQISVKLTLTSNGDRWDKSGSCFIIPSNSKNNILQYFLGKDSLPTNKDLYENLKGITPLKNYKPAIELLRFMTPFGVGFYSDNTKVGRKPVYVDSWAKQSIWQQNISHLASELQNEVWIGVWIDTWTKEGYKISLSLDFNETEAEIFPLKKTKILPILNTVYYAGEKGYADIFARKDINVTINLKEDAKNTSLYYLVTGHGGHSGGDEFTQKENVLYHNDKKIHQFTPWRNDCASFRRFNPTSGVWLKKDTADYIDFKAKKYKRKVIEERIASSDLSRSNWCPGSDVTPIKIKLGNLTKGKHNFTFSIPKAQEKNGSKLNHWLVSSYLYYEKE